MKKFLPGIVIFCLIGSFFPFPIPITIEAHPDPGWLSGWSYRSSVSITGATGAGTDYQVPLTVHSGSGSNSAGVIYLESHCTDFPNDIRFTNDDGVTELDHWIEDSSADPAKFWIEIKDDLGSNQDFYIYYGKSGASSASNGTSTFIQWHGSATADFQDSNDINEDFVYEAKARATANDGNGNCYVSFGVNDGAGKFVCCVPRYISGIYFQFRTGQACPGPPAPSEMINESPFVALDTWVRIKITTELGGNGSEAHYYIDDNEIASGITGNSVPSGPLGLYMVELPSGAQGEQEWSFARKYIDPEPSVGTPGSEETVAAGYEMASGSYRIWQSSINVGGHQQTSTSYKMRDTIGEFAVGVVTSTSYKLRMGYQPMQEVYLSLALSTTSVSMSPDIGGVTGGTSTGNVVATVTTDDPAGYSLSVNASTSPALKKDAENYFADYAPASADPDYNWSINSTTSEFGFTPYGDDTATKYQYSGGVCNSAGTADADKCWYNFSTSTETVAQSTSSNHPDGATTTIKFQSESGTSNIQESGEYQATITVTAIAL